MQGGNMQTETLVKDVSVTVAMEGLREERKITAYLRPGKEEQDFRELAEQIINSYWEGGGEMKKK